MSEAKVRMNHFRKDASCNGLPALEEWKRVHGLPLKYKALNTPRSSGSQWDDLHRVTDAGYDCRQFKSQW